MDMPGRGVRGERLQLAADLRGVPWRGCCTAGATRDGRASEGGGYRSFAPLHSGRCCATPAGAKRYLRRQAAKKRGLTSLHLVRPNFGNRSQL